ncbi:alginate export family protein [Methylomonas sp. MED-D]|uniref:alginate export family protein n=1 Tax=unclassified Methylomonas TaxID=2608980 RepID=UPI0028A4CCD3|nr:alginate export family protein [Methylomonas sp. MV1]MDT4331350.1 alginate export family protein [Methylomonas sp. MV1]
MFKSTHILPAGVLAIAGAGTPAQADITKEVEDALNFYHYGSNGAVKMDLNYRWENVDQDKGPIIPGKAPKRVETANANTARLRLGLLSPTFYDFQAYAEYEGNYALQEDYDQGGTTLNRHRDYSLIADPDRSELNQFWLSYKGIADTLIKVGRQRIKFDDDRFIGNVGWRQMESTYDSVLVTHNNQTLFGLTVNAGYLDHVQNIFGETDTLNAPVLNLNYKVGDWGNLIGYGYWLDFRERANYAKSSQTYGLRLDGKSPQFFDTVNFLYTAEWGKQSNYADNPNHYQADRINLMGGLSAFNLTLQGAMEQLNGYGLNKTFNTPLGTNHAFQGWADLFINPLGNATLGQGIRDVFATASYKAMNDTLIVTGMYHDFYDDTGGVEYGSEWDFSILKKFGKHYSLLAKYANFNTENAAFTDTQKIWLQANVSF